jgi:exodeoxyribonuclease V gamma subunit
VRAKDRVALWVRHLVLGCVAPGDVARESRLIGEDDDLVLGPVAAPAKQLRVLADRYWEGIHRPLPFFPESALAAVRAKQDPLEAAQHVFASPRRPEKDDPYLELVFGEEDPLGRAPLKHEFLELARVVFGPLEASARRDR